MRLLPGLLVAVTLLAAVPMAVPAHEYKAGDIRIGHPWTRATPPSSRTGAGYLTLTNNGSAPDRLLGATSPLLGRAEIHATEMDGTVMKMRHLAEGIALPVGVTVELKPGGFHMMFPELTGPIEQGKRVPVTLVFEKAGKVDVEMEVSAIGAREPGAAPEHHH